MTNKFRNLVHDRIRVLGWTAGTLAIGLALYFMAQAIRQINVERATRTTQANQVIRLNCDRINQNQKFIIGVIKTNWHVLQKEKVISGLIITPEYRAQVKKISNDELHQLYTIRCKYLSIIPEENKEIKDYPSLIK